MTAEVLAFSFPNPFKLLGTVLSPILDLGGELMGGIVESVVGDLAGAVVGAVIDLAFSVLHFFWTAAEPELTSSWFYGSDAPYQRMVLLAMPLFVVFLLAGTIQGALRGDTAGMLRMILLRLPGSVLAMSVAVVLTDVLLAVTDDMSAALLVDFRDDVEQVGRVLGTLAIGGSLVHKLLLLAFGVVGLLAALVVVIELFIRAALIYLVAAFCPLVLAAGIWEPMRGGVRKLCELAFALIISKLGIAAALAVCSAAIVSVAPGGQPTAIPTPEQAAMQAQQSSAQTVGILVSAITMFCVAAFMPFVLWRLLPIAEAASVAHGVRGAPFRGAHLGGSAVTMGLNNPATAALRMRRPSSGAGPDAAGGKAAAAAAGPAGAAVAGTAGAAKAASRAVKDRGRDAAGQRPRAGPARSGQPSQRSQRSQPPSSRPTPRRPPGSGKPGRRGGDRS